MKKLLKSSVLFLLGILVFSSCSSDDIPECDFCPPQEYLIFGHFFGECFGEQCVEIFKIEDGKLYEDSNDIYPSSNNDSYDGDFNEIDQNLLNEIPNLIFMVPNDLLQETNKVIGQPDAGDWGGIYIEIKNEEGVKSWLIDKAEGNLPDYLIDFKQSVEEAIEKINE